jgi:hypothetical protein
MAKTLQSTKNKDGAACREAIETAGEVFSDGTTLELIRPDSGAEATSLLRWDGEKAAVSQQFKVNGKIYRPLRLNFTSPKAVRLPGHIAPYRSTRDLFNDICKVLTQYTDIAENHIWQTAYFILGSWLADRLLVAPFLSVIAPLGTAKAQFLRLFSSFCRRPLMLAEVTPAAISGFASLCPTILFDEPVLSRRAARLLFATNNYHHFALGNGRIMDAFTAKAIFSVEPLGDPLLASQALEITLPLAGRQVPFLEDSARERIADEFQSKLLQYRLANIGKIRTPEVDVTELTVPMQDVARALGACFPDDKEMQLGVIQLLRERDQDAYLDSSSELGSAIVEGLLFCCHSEKRSQVLCGELADIVNAIWAKRGEGRQTTPESVGWKLRALDLRTEPIDGVGKGLRLTEAGRARIHSLAQALKVPSLRQTIQTECPHCKLAFGKQ